MAYLIWHGELPNQSQLEEFIAKEKSMRGLSDDLIDVMRKFPKEAHPMATLRTAVSFLGIEDTDIEDHATDNLLERAMGMYAKIPQIVATDFRLRNGKEPIAPDNSLGFSENFFHMCFGEVPAAETVKCFDISMTLYAEHSFNASTFTSRVIASSLSGIYSAVTGAIGSLKGPLHGGANEAVMYMLQEVGTAENAQDWMLDALATKKKIMGFGHRVYRSGDSRVPTMTEAYKEMVDIIGTDEAKMYWEMSSILDKTMVDAKGIYPNLDFPAGPAYYLMGFEIPMFTPIFVMSRITGWTAHIMEQLADNKLIRPLSNYTGEAQRDVVALDKR